jgi:hypothetical protein
LLVIPALDVKDIVPEKILERRLVKKVNVAVTQVLVLWMGLPNTVATWEDYEVLRHRFASALAWGHAVSSEGVLSPPPSWWLQPDGLNRYWVIILWALGLSGRMRQPIGW